MHNRVKIGIVLMAALGLLIYAFFGQWRDQPRGWRHYNVDAEITEFLSNHKETRNSRILGGLTNGEGEFAIFLDSGMPAPGGHRMIKLKRLKEGESIEIVEIVGGL